MKINKVLIGNNNEAFIENRFTEGVNIISSDDNNKGKTIVIQSMMFSLGNDPVFPSSFNFEDYYHIIELEIDKDVVSICRKRKSFTVLYKGNISIFDNLSEFKYYVNKTLFNIPIILKDGSKKLVDPVLLYQMFFIGQDNKVTSNIFLHGYYHKEDFFNMLYSYYGINVADESFDNDEIKEQIKILQAEKKELQRQNKILNSTLSAIGIVSMSNDRLKFEKKLSKVENLKNIIINLSSKRNNATSRKIKNEITLKELRSLNQSLTAGKLQCLDCNSTKIGYSTADHSYTFDISSTEIRNQIISSITDKIEAYREEVDNITSEINQHQEELKSLLSEDEVSIESLLMYKCDLVKASEADTNIIGIDNNLKNLKAKLKNQESSLVNIQEEKDKLNDEIIKEMNDFYRKIDPQGNLLFDGLFSKRQSVYSGCEKTEFYLSKLYAFLSVFKHHFPIVVDCFRDGELSSHKEKKVLDLFNEFNNQVIFTVTLKEQELKKYDNLSHINHISYTPHEPCKLLSSKYVEEFKNNIKKFCINII